MLIIAFAVLPGVSTVCPCVQTIRETAAMDSGASCSGLAAPSPKHLLILHSTAQQQGIAV
jgi:hypothetical protein